MKGFLCATMTAALSGEGMVRGLRYGQAALSLSVCVCVCECVSECVCETEKSACVHWEITQECEDTCQRQRI